MLLTSAACLGSHRAKLCSCCRDCLRLMATAVLHASHCRTACLQALQEHAAAHNTWGSVLRAGWSQAMASPSRALLAASYDRDNSMVQTDRQQLEAQGQAQAAPHSRCWQQQHLKKGWGMLTSSYQVIFKYVYY